MFGYCATVISALCWPSLLDPIPAFGCMTIAVLLFRWSKLLAGVLLAIAWTSLFCYQLLTFHTLDNHSYIETRAEIISLVYRNRDRISADIELLHANNIAFPKQRMRVEWPSTISVQVGEVWQLQIKPKPIASTLNQGGFNRQRYYLAQHIIGTGKVIAATRLEASSQLRNQLRQKLIDDVASFSNGDLILALMIGDKQFITAEHWQGLRRSGTGHLIAISGLHLSVLALWGLFLSRFILVRLHASQTLFNLKCATVIALLCCLFYAYLAGFALPTQRALIMLSLIILLSFLRRFSTPFERLLWALFIILVIDPLSMMSAGFWLSFGALAVILSFMQQGGEKVSQQPLSIGQHFKQKAFLFWSLQWRLSLLLGALQMLLFGGIAPYGILFNLVFVPWFSLVVIPLTFVGLICSCLGLTLPWLLTLVNGTITPLTWSFTQLESISFAWIATSAEFSLTGLFLLLGLFLFRVVGKTVWRYLVLVFILPSALLMASPLFTSDRQDWKLHLLDVGQGLSAVIEKQGRVLIYDTGAAFGKHFSYAKSVIIPFLQYKGLTQVDYLVLSHIDNDHAGGAADLINHYPKLQLITDVDPVRFQQQNAISCRPKQFDWQGLTIKILGPIIARQGNNGSCVVQIDDGDYQILLPGDIEYEAEQALVAQYAREGGSVLQSHLLLAPHHGSNTSSSRAFITAVSPQLVLYPAGLHNRYQFPKRAVIERYHDIDAEQYMVGRNGQVSINFEQDGLKINSYRYDISPFWYNRVFQFGQLENTRVE